MNKLATIVIAVAVVGLAGLCLRKTRPKPPVPDQVPAWYQHHQNLHERLNRLVESQSPNH